VRLAVATREAGGRRQRKKKKKVCRGERGRQWILVADRWLC